MVDKNFGSRVSDRRHLTELNQDKIYSSLGREKRLSSVERENKLVSPEKVLSLRRNSAGTAADTVTQGAQPLSSLLNDEVNGVGRSTSKTSRDFAESRRYVSETYQHESRSNHLSSINKHEYNSSEISSPINQVLASKNERSEMKRAVVDNASNVKGKKSSDNQTKFVHDWKWILIYLTFNFSIVHGVGCYAISSRLVGCHGQNRYWAQSRWQTK